MVSQRLAAMPTAQFRELLEAAPVLGVGIGGTRSLVRLADRDVFVKRVPLTDLERRPEHRMSTANLFDLPLGCQYGVGSPSFSVWREVVANVRTTELVQRGRSGAFALLHHWRVLDGDPGPLSDELAEIDRAVEPWDGSPAVRRRLEEIGAATASVALCIEVQPATLSGWLARTGGPGDRDPASALAMVEHCLLRDVASMNDGGLLHFDAHFDNVLTDGEQLFLADLGLATSARFALTAAEHAFVERNRSHDACHTITRLVDWVVVAYADVDGVEARNELIRAWSAGDRIDLPDHAAGVLDRYAPVAAVINEFYLRLHTQDRATPYPYDQVRDACDRSSLGWRW